MTTSLPPPPVPADADLTDFKFMPLEVARLRRSRAWLICKRRPELAFFMLNLWSASWHERPAGSLEDDDDVLADAAMCSPERWPKVRAEVMRGWVKCSDGRLYHPVVAEKVMDSWHGKAVARWRKECDRIRKENHKRKENQQVALEFPPEPKRTAGAFPAENAGFPAEGGGIPPEKPLKEREREGKGEEEERERTPPGQAAPIPRDWQPSAEDLAWAATARPDIQPARLKLETEGFINHAIGNRRVGFEWGRLWRGWIGKTKIGGQENGSTQRAQGTGTRRPAGAIRTAVNFAAALGGHGGERHDGTGRHADGERVAAAVLLDPDREP